MAEVRERHVAVRGIGTPVLEAGPDAGGPAVVFLHGNPGSGEDWRALVGAAGDHGRAIAFDLPGYGHAGKPADFDYSLRGFADWIGAALDELGVMRAHLVVHDFGGGFGFMLAGLRPDLAASFVVVNAGPLPGYRWHRLARMLRTPVLGELMQAVTTPKLLVRALLREDPRLPRADAERMGRNYDRATKRAALCLYRATDDRDPGIDWAALRARRLPGLVFWGATDPFTEPRFAHVVADELLPGARVVMLEHAGHWPFLDEPARADAEIVPFLAAQLAAASG